MEQEYEKVCYDNYRQKTFEGSIFEKNRKNCTVKKMSNAGFYFAGTDQQEDKVICYSCGLEKSDWKLNSTDPWLEHEKLNPQCFYLEIKKKPKNELTVSNFLLIEKQRFQRLNDEFYEKNSQRIENTIKLFLENNGDEAKLKEVQESNIQCLAAQ